MDTTISTMPLNSMFQSLNNLSLIELDEVMNRIIGIRRQKLPSVLSETETNLLQKINKGIPKEIQKKYNRLAKKRDGYSLTKEEYNELLELTTYIESHDVRRLSYLIELSKIRNKSLDEILDELQIKPQIHVA